MRAAGGRLGENSEVLLSCGSAVAAASLVVAGLAVAEPAVKARPAEAPGFHLFTPFRALRPAPPLPDVAVFGRESLVRLPGDPDSVLTLGGPVPSGEPRFRFAVEVNEAVLKLIAPDPKVHPDDVRSRAGGDWQPVDATGRPYQLRLGARLVW